jgi:hypothetical protein
VSWRTVRVVALLALAGFYVAAASEHARRVNTFKARGDQTGYLSDAEDVYANWHGATPPILVGERNRMPLYAGYQALFYRPTISDPEFFEIAKTRNIYLSLALLAAMYPIFCALLPSLPAFNLIVIVAFGYFVFKAGYVQSELLFYFLFFIAFLMMFLILAGRRESVSARRVLEAATAGAAAGLAYLTKAATVPLMVVFAAACLVDAASLQDRGRRAARLASAGIALVAFLAVLSPYLTTNKRAFGHYFYNVNTTFYVWYDNWPQASVGTIKHGDGVGWPEMPADELPSAARYWREHTISQITDRIRHGLWDMVERSYTTYWYFKYVVLYTVCGLAVLVAGRKAFIELIRSRRAAFVWLVTYAAAYLIGIAFYEPVSGTGTSRFLLAHILPYLFVLSLWLSRPPYSETEWHLAGLTITVQHFHLLVTVMLSVDLIFTLWPRLMTTYGGF